MVIWALPGLVIGLDTLAGALDGTELDEVQGWVLGCKRRPRIRDLVPDVPKPAGELIRRLLHLGGLGGSAASIISISQS